MAKYVGENALAELVAKIQANMQSKLVSGTNLKTINNTSLLGSGNISIGGGTATDVQIDSTSITSSGVANIKTMNGNYNATTNKLATKNDLPDISTKANTNASNIDASTWKTALSLDNVENYKIVTGSFLAKANPTTVNTGLTTVVGFCAMIQMNQTGTITSYYPLLHTISNGEAKVSLRQTSSGAVNTSGAVYIRYIAFGY